MAPNRISPWGWWDFNVKKQGFENVFTTVENKKRCTLIWWHDSSYKENSMLPLTQMKIGGH